jgi:hypothetical protein
MGVVWAWAKLVKMVRPMPAETTRVLRKKRLDMKTPE